VQPPAGERERQARTKKDDVVVEPEPYYGIDAASLLQSSGPPKKGSSISEFHQEQVRAAVNNDWGGMPRLYGISADDHRGLSLNNQAAPSQARAPAFIGQSCTLSANAMHYDGDDDEDDESLELEDHEPIDRQRGVPQMMMMVPNDVY